MKIVQSFFTNTTDLQSLHGGWYSTRYHLMGWALSACLLKKYNEKVELLTDTFGKHILVDELKLPYTKVRTVFDHFEMDKQFEDIWLLKKIYSHTVHDEPFLFIDGDAFMFEKFPDRLTSSGLIAQNLNAKSVRFYTDCVRLMKDTMDFIPQYINKPFLKHKHVWGCSTGITGGKDLTFYKNFYNEVKKFLELNYKNWKKSKKLTSSTAFNITIEEAFFYNLAQDQDAQIAYLFEYPIEDYSAFIDFYKCPSERSFLHLMLGMKSVLFVCNRMESRLRHEFPETYESVNDFCDKHLSGSDHKNKKGIDFKYQKMFRSKALQESKPMGNLSMQADLEYTESKDEILALDIYEQKIDSFIEGLSYQDKERYDSYLLEQIKNYQDLTELKEDDNFYLTISPYCIVLRTDAPFEFIQTNHSTVNINLRKKKEHYKEYSGVNDILILYNPDNQSVIEEVLLSEKLLFHWIEETNKLSYSDILGKIEKLCKDTFKFYLKDILIDKLRYFIYSGVISVQYETELDPFYC